MAIALLSVFLREPARASVAEDDAQAPGLDVMAYMRRYAALFAMLLTAFGFQFTVAYGVAGWYAVLLMPDDGLRPATAGLVMGSLTLLTGLSAGLLGG